MLHVVSRDRVLGFFFWQSACQYIHSGHKHPLLQTRQLPGLHWQHFCFFLVCHLVRSHLCCLTVSIKCVKKASLHTGRDAFHAIFVFFCTLNSNARATCQVLKGLACSIFTLHLQEPGPVACLCGVYLCLCGFPSSLPHLHIRLIINSKVPIGVNVEVVCF